MIVSYGLHVRIVLAGMPELSAYVAEMIIISVGY